jgi:hypothetical protein
VVIVSDHSSANYSFFCSASLKFFFHAEPPRLHTTFKSAVGALLAISKLAHTNIKVLKWSVDKITSKDVWWFVFRFYSFKNSSSVRPQGENKV